jgi:membrane associated rhomboid family serine protease
MNLRNLQETDLIAIAGDESGQLEALSLVLSAVGIDHWQDQETGRLLVRNEDAPAALFHLNQYHLENRNWPPPKPLRQPLSTQPQPTLLVMVSFALFFSHTGPWSTGSVWFTQGAIDSAAILTHGEWWRLITALTLHADLSHLLGNCLIGGLVIHLLSRMIGYGQSWLLLIITGTIGNFCNIAFRQQPHLSVGFSTSIFAAIGLLTGLQLGRSAIRSYKALLLPLGAGVGLLAFLGSEGVRTDLGAHLFGFASGVSGGWLFTRTGLVERLQAPALQVLQLLLALALPILAWIWALY